MGSVNDLLDSSETIVEHREYDSFGTVDSPYQLVGEEYLEVGSAGMLSRVAHVGSIWEEGPQQYPKGA